MSGRSVRADGAARAGEMDLDALRHLRNKVLRVVCSEPWGEHCIGEVVHGRVARKDDQAKELRRKGVYPPGGLMTGMVRCCRCQHWTPAAREARQRTKEPQPNGSVRVTYTDPQPLCVDCYYNDLPLLEAVHVPSSPGFTTRIKDADVAAHFGTAEGPDGKPHVNGGIRRRRYLHPDGSVREPFRGEDGFDYENVFEVSPPAPVAAEAA
jgi:hypothetical protein